MFDKHFHTTVHEDHSREAARILGADLKSISAAEIKSKDRVDISLEEYERLKSEIKRLTERERTLMSVIERLNIPADILEYILPDSVKTYTCFDIDIFNEVQRYRIEFGIPRERLKGF